jgi:hypothetical protein
VRYLEWIHMYLRKSYLGRTRVEKYRRRYQIPLQGCEMYGSTAGGYLTLEYNSDYHPYIAIKIDMKLLGILQITYVHNVVR